MMVSPLHLQQSICSLPFQKDAIWHYVGTRGLPEDDEAIFGDMDDMEVIFDDIIITAKDGHEHVGMMRKLLQKSTRSKCLKVQSNKTPEQSK